MRFAALNPALKRRSKFRGRSASKDESGGSAEANRMESVIEFLRRSGIFIVPRTLEFFRSVRATGPRAADSPHGTPKGVRC